MIELILFGAAILGVGGFAVDKVVQSEGKLWYERMNTTWYKLTRSWWKPAFLPETAGVAIAAMIDSDRNCEMWKYDGYDRTLDSESLGVNVYAGHRRARVNIKRDDGSRINIKITDHDDYILHKALEDFGKREKELRLMKQERETSEIINRRITKGYVDTVEMIERKILHKEPEQATQLRNLIDAAPQCEPEVKKRKKAAA